MHKDIQSQIKDAMLKKDALRLQVLRSLVAAFTNELVAKNRKPQEELLDDEAVAVIKRAVKQRKDSIEQFEKGGRIDLVESEKAELSVFEQFLPKMASSEEIKKVAEQKKLELQVTDKLKIGILTGAVMKELKGNADGNEVKKIIETLFD